MKIIFICGSLVPAKDGVGDYCRRLAGELIRQGHQVALIGISKPTSGSEQIIQSDSETEIQVLILSREIPLNKRIKIIRRFVHVFNPDWISFQVSAYAYNDYGAPIQLPFYLRAIGRNHKWHIMIHEHFVRKEELNYKERVIRHLQILHVKTIKFLLQPALWHASIPIYKKMMEREIKVRCKLLGIFANIPPETNVNSSALIGECKKYIRAVYFGSAPVKKERSEILKKLQEQIHKLSKPLQVIFCGRMQEDGYLFIRDLERIVKGNKGKVTIKGELPAAEVSKLLFSVDFGIARVSPEFIGKSGCALAMLEHGLPLWIPRADAKNFKDNIDFRPELCFSKLNDYLLPVSKKRVIQRLPIIASTLIKDFQEN